MSEEPEVIEWMPWPSLEDQQLGFAMGKAWFEMAMPWEMMMPRMVAIDMVLRMYVHAGWLQGELEGPDGWTGVPDPT